MTAEQFCDALSDLADDWPRFPDSLDIDFSAVLTGQPVSMPHWIWTGQPLEYGQAGPLRVLREAKARSGVSSPDVLEQVPRHQVVFRKRFALDKVPAQAYAVVAASQGVSVYVNGRPGRGVRSNGEYGGRISLIDIKPNLVVGDNLIVLEVSSHTQKGMNDIEAREHPASRNHVNAVSGVGFCVRLDDGPGRVRDIVTDESWRVFRAPEGSWRDVAYEDSEWMPAVVLPPGVSPVDEGPGLPPIVRRDFANEPIELTDPLRKALTTAAQPGRIRAALLGADALMVALDRPNREQVTSCRQTASTTLQAMELTQGRSLDGRVKRAAAKLTSAAANDPSAWITDTYIRMLGRAPSEEEAHLALQSLGSPVTEQSVADFLWVMAMLPEFGFIH